MAKKQTTKAEDGSKGEPTTCLLLWHMVSDSLARTLHCGGETLQMTDILLLRMRTEGVSKLLARLASELGYRFAPLQWREVPPEAGPWDCLDWVTQDRRRWLEDIQRFLRTAIFERGELPLGWEDEEYPLRPLDSREAFARWLVEIVAQIRCYPGCVLSAQLHFRNAHRWLSAHNIADRPEWPATPNDVSEIERQLDGLIRWVVEPTEVQSARTWHDADETPPSEYPAGPLTGTKQQLAKWIMDDDDPRNLDTKLDNGVYWGREDKRTESSIWFRTQERFAEANAKRLAGQR